ncbi:MAG: glycosyltransferase family 4 protein [Actinomycetaceae bacterium]|nr:glycosyltransferase family 4 protein [Actinomycetaceae bacterium]
MRIALVSDCYPPRLGGIESQVHGLAHALVQAGHDVSVLTATPEGDERGDRISIDQGVLVRRLTINLPFDLPVNPFAEHILRSDLPRYDAVHIHTGIVSPFARMATDVCVSLGIPAIVTWHCMLSDAPWYGLVNPIRDWARAGLILTAVSGPAAQHIEMLAHSQVVVSTLPNLIDSEPWDSVRTSRPGLSHTLSPLRVVTATRLTRRKRVLALADLIRTARSRGADLELHIFGDGPLRRRLTRNESSGIICHGRVDADALAQAYANADVFVSPVVKEAFGIAALEARASGLPVIYRAGSGISEFITHATDGLRVSSDDEMAAALTMLSRHPARWERLQRGAMSGTTLTWQRGLGKYIRLYEAARSVRPAGFSH